MWWIVGLILVFAAGMVAGAAMVVLPALVDYLFYGR